MILFFADGAYRRAKITDEMLVFAFARCFVGLAKQRRWVNGREHSRRQFRRQDFTTLASDAE